MKRSLRWLIAPATAAAAAVTIIPLGGAPAAAASDPELYAALHASSAFPNARGHVEYERTTAQREVEVTVNRLPSRLYGHYVTVYVNLKKVGTMRVN